MTVLNKVIQNCQVCDCFIEYDNIIGVCDNETNEHYQHVLHRNHPACGIFLATYDTIEEMLIQPLDNHQDV